MGDAAKDAEILVLRHQLSVLQLQVARPRLSWSDRAVIATLARLIARERWAAFLVTPETIFRWHRTLVRRRWTYPHRRPGRPALPDETVELIVRLAKENPRWGYLRIVGELRKLGVTVSKGSVANVLRRHDLRPAPRRTGPTWGEFLRSQAEGHLGHRLLHRRHGDAAPLLRPVRDRARTTGRAPPRHHRQPQRGLGDPGCSQLHHRPRRGRPAVAIIKTPMRSPRANAFAERFVRTARSECLDHLLVFSRRHLEAILVEYLCHYNQARSHRSLNPCLSG